jgi:hypothetical protein
MFNKKNKLMKKITHLLAPLLICAVNSSFAAVSDQAGTEKKISNQCTPYKIKALKEVYSTAGTSLAILETVKKELGSFLEIIPVNTEKDHGFNDRAEFAKASPASIYKIVGVDIAGKTFETNLYNVVVAVNGEYRAVLTVSVENGQHEIQTVGAALMAKELQAIEIAQPLAAGQEHIMVNVYSRSAGFVAYKNESITIENADLIPLESAKSGIFNMEVNRTAKLTYKLSEAIEALHLN